MEIDKTNPSYLFLLNTPHDLLVAFINSHWDLLWENGIGDAVYEDSFIREKIVPVIYKVIAEGKDKE